ncbi:MAG: hypothetical protein HYT89_04320, partial [Candidatus Omnitrophica bacterium]|nr:hypothetical protein [Candidatus Omnitrophota bacterium]
MTRVSTLNIKIPYWLRPLSFACPPRGGPDLSDRLFGRAGRGRRNNPAAGAGSAAKSAAGARARAAVAAFPKRFLEGPALVRTQLRGKLAAILIDESGRSRLRRPPFKNRSAGVVPQSARLRGERRRGGKDGLLVQNGFFVELAVGLRQHLRGERDKRNIFLFEETL